MHRDREIAHDRHDGLALDQAMKRIHELQQRLVLPRRINNNNRASQQQQQLGDAIVVGIVQLGTDSSAEAD